MVFYAFNIFCLIFVQPFHFNQYQQYKLHIKPITMQWFHHNRHNHHDDCPSPGRSPQFHQFQHQTPSVGGDKGSPVDDDDFDVDEGQRWMDDGNWSDDDEEDEVGKGGTDEMMMTMIKVMMMVMMVLMVTIMMMEWYLALGSDLPPHHMSGHMRLKQLGLPESLLWLNFFWFKLRLLTIVCLNVFFCKFSFHAWLHSTLSARNNFLF